MPEVIISNWYPRFTSRFWKEFFYILRTDLQLSIAFHPQIDGRSEVAIRVLENFLRRYVQLHPHMWSKRLSVAEFITNVHYNGVKEEGLGANWILSTSWRNVKRVSCCNVVFVGYESGFLVHTL